MPASQNQQLTNKPKLFIRLKMSSNFIFQSFKTAFRPRDRGAPPPYDGKAKVPHLDDRTLNVDELHREVHALCHGQAIVYNNLDTPSQHPPITAEDTPQWGWTKTECQEWFFALLTTKLGYTAIDADAMAAKLDGFGPNIYMRTSGTWGELLGNEEEGLGVYVWVLESRDWEGAVPEGILLRHGGQVAR